MDYFFPFKLITHSTTSHDYGAFEPTSTNARRDVDIDDFEHGTYACCVCNENRINGFQAVIIISEQTNLFGRLEEGITE